MKRRLFIAINLDPAAVRAIAKVEEGIKAEVPPDLLRDIRFVPEENWHITISFLGYQDEDGLTGTLRALGNAVPQLKIDKVVFEKLSYGPPGFALPVPSGIDGSSSRGKQPRMIWLSADKETSRELGAAKEGIEDELENNNVRFNRERRPMSGHITLARLDLNREQVLELPDISRTLNITSAVWGLDLMESELRRGGPEYSIMQRFSTSSGTT